LRYLVQQLPDHELNVVTTNASAVHWDIDIPGVKIHYLLSSKKMPSKWKRALGYLSFNIRALFLLIRSKPKAILYYETLSAWAPCFYKKYLSRQSRLLIHYHEYMSPAEYAQGMWLNNYLHKIEKRTYRLADWVSHTNADRMQLFLKDLGKQAPVNTFIMPNYPPASWAMQAATVPRNTDSRIGFIYVGALSLSTMYTREMAQWISMHPDEYYWDIYSDMHDQEAIEYLRWMQAPNIRFLGAIAYDGLPSILPRYDIGVVLYKGTTHNYRYNAPNKFFEYHICGLNVLYPPAMKGMQPYRQTGSKPWVEEVDFDNPALPQYERALRVELISGTTYTAENVYSELCRHLT
jgi:hypothetical protein